MYVLFLRGINVGGHKKVSMAELKKILSDLGYNKIKTFLNSGNVVFEASGKLKKIHSDINAKLAQSFDFEVNSILRNSKDVLAMATSQIFANTKLKKEIRLYVSFLAKKNNAKIKIPYVSPDKSFKILKVENLNIYSVLDLSKSKTTEAMAVLEREFGSDITTRNYNTIVKIGSYLAEN